MSASTNKILRQELSIDKEGIRTYTITFLVVTTDIGDGPEVVANTPELPNVGVTYSSFASDWTGKGTLNDADPWVWCTPELEARPHRQVDNEPTTHWEVTTKFTNAEQTRDNTNTVQNPLLEPNKLSGNFSLKSIATTKDKDGDLIQTTAFEPIKVDRDDAHAQIIIERNKGTIDLSTITPLINKVNNATLWGLATRKVKFNEYSWRELRYATNTKYYRERLVFGINPNTWSRDDIPNKSKKTINGGWIEGVFSAFTTDVNDPSKYIRAVDKQGNPTEYFLNKTTGEPSSSSTPTYLDTVHLYGETNFASLGLPATLP